MADHAIEVKSEVATTRANMPLTRSDLERMKEHRVLIQEFVQSQLKEGIDNDYAVIPGTKKKTLLKPGAEKLLRLFNLGARVRMAEKELDRDQNFAFFAYRCEVYNLATGIVIAECEGAANSQEVKYKERKVWRNGPGGRKEQVSEQTPIADITNTLMKMAQKRAVVGAAILATGASDFFSQDIETKEDAEAVGQRARQETAKPAAAPAGSGTPGEYVLPFGKYKGLSLSQVEPADLQSYADFLSKQAEISPKGQEVVDAIAAFFGK
jgi:hypothetical protein